MSNLISLPPRAGQARRQRRGHGSAAKHDARLRGGVTMPPAMRAVAAMLAVRPAQDLVAATQVRAGTCPRWVASPRQVTEVTATCPRRWAGARLLHTSHGRGRTRAGAGAPKPWSLWRGRRKCGPSRRSSAGPGQAGASPRAGRWAWTRTTGAAGRDARSPPGPARRTGPVVGLYAALGPSRRSARVPLRPRRAWEEAPPRAAAWPGRTRPRGRGARLTGADPCTPDSRSNRLGRSGLPRPSPCAGSLRHG